MKLLNQGKKAYIGLLLILVFATSACSSILVQRRDQGLEESGTELAPDQTCDRIRSGARLILAYDEQNNSFKGHVENITDGILRQVQVEVHLSNGIELGPTAPVDLNPDERVEVMLAATTRNFEGWTAHPEVGGAGKGERGNDDEGDNEHDRDGEHDREEGGEGKEGDTG